MVRKTRCDEARPSCGSCVKYNTRCPGYQQRGGGGGLKSFVAGKRNAVRPRGRQQQQQSAASSVVHVGRPRPDSEQSYVPGTKRTVVVLSHAVIEGRRRQPENSRSWLQAPKPVTALEKLQDAVDRRLKVLTEPRDNTTLFVGALLESLWCILPPKPENVPPLHILIGAARGMHRSPALVTALCAVGSYIVGQLYQNENVLLESHLAYGISLRNLQQALYHPQEWKSSETLDASLVLYYYKILTGTGTPNDSKCYARGIVHLIQVRGMAHIEPWADEMLRCLPHVPHFPSQRAYE